VARRLIAAGVLPGDKIAILTANQPVAISGALAALYVGGTWVPTNCRDAEAQIGLLLSTAECKWLLYGDSVADRVPEIQAGSTGLQSVIALSDLEAAPGSSEPVSEAPMVRADPDMRAAVFFTGGTTSVPKGVVFLHRNMLSLVENYGKFVHHDGDITLASAPLTHFAGRQCIASLVSGGTTVILPRFETTAVLDAIATYGVTMMSVAPTMLYALLDDPTVRSRDLSSLQRLVYGSGPTLLNRLKQALEVFGPVLHGAYGQTESPMLISALLPADHVVNGSLAPEARLSSVGRPTGASDVRIVNESGQLVRPGVIGEIVVRGDYQMHEYLDNPEATAAAHWGSFLRTGDLGWLDDEGFLSISGRKKEMIISGGFNVYSAEVENALASRSDVLEAAVFGLPAEHWGESVNAVVTMRANAAATAAELQAWVRDRLGGVKTRAREQE
jgi:fatty-acyl-CoA synthase